MNYFDVEHFCFGRSKVLDILQKRLSDLKEGYRQNVALIGYPFVGKSVILQHFASYLRDEDVDVVYLNLDRNDFYVVLQRFIASLLVSYSQSQGFVSSKDLNDLKEFCQDKIPQTLSVMKKIEEQFLQGKKSQAFFGLLTLPDVFVNETGRYCAVIFDEFQNLDRLGVDDTFKELGKKVMTQRKVFYVLSSSYPMVAQRILSEQLSLLFGNFEILRVEPLKQSVSLGLVERHLKEMKISQDLKCFLVDFLGGYPLYINLVCREILYLASFHRQEDVYVPLLSQAIENCVFDQWGAISRHFDLFVQELSSGKGNDNIDQLLVEIARGVSQYDDLVSKMPYWNKTKIKQKLSRLIDFGVVVKAGHFYYIKDKLFKYWLKNVYHRRMTDVLLNFDEQRLSFMTEFRELVDGFYTLQRKDLSLQLKDLLNHFDENSFHLNGRKYKLEPLKDWETKVVDSQQGGSFDVVQARSADHEWFFAVYKDRIDEEAMQALMAESKKLGKKAIRRVIVALNGVEKNVKVKALHERFWIWSQNEIGVLSNVFDQPLFASESK